jgi:DNA (cytosine-5)-methyltransferase 1
MLTFLALADAKKPKWIVWENVPGVLSSNGGRDFGTFLGALGELGYGFAYRVLDAQYFGVAQRRRRVFVVGYLGDWRVAAAVLFERESLQGNIKPSRKKREEAATYAQGSVGEAGDVSCVGGNLSPTVTSKWKTGYGGPSGSNETGNMVYAPTIIDQSEGKWISPNGEETIGTIMARDYKGLGNQDLEDGRGLAIRPHAVAQPIAFEPGKMQRLGYGYSDNGTSPTLRSEPGDNQLAVAQPISIDAECNARTNQFGTLVRGGEGGTQQFVAQPLYYESHPQDSRVKGPKDVADTVSANYGMGGGNTPLVQQPIAVDIYNYTTNDHTTQTIRSQSDTDHIGAVLQPMAVDVYNQSIDGQTSATITEAVGGTNTSGPKVMHSMAIRRLTPKECERLQGFPDDWTKIPYRNKEADQCPDGPRYKACGNSMAVPVMRWIGQRIQYVENLMKEL